MASGDTKTNQYLDIAANGTRADLPTDTCCETRTQTLIRGVAERIMDVEDEVEEIKNNPDVVDIVPTYAALQNYDTSSLTDKDIIRVLQDETHDGDSTYYRYNAQSGTWTYVGESKQYEDFVGTDGTAGGQNGLVPAPAATDAGKFLKADGTWDTAGGGGATPIVKIVSSIPALADMENDKLYSYYHDDNLTVYAKGVNQSGVISRQAITPNMYNYAKKQDTVARQSWYAAASAIDTGLESPWQGALAEDMKDHLYLDFSGGSDNPFSHLSSELALMDGTASFSNYYGADRLSDNSTIWLVRGMDEWEIEMGEEMLIDNGYTFDWQNKTVLIDGSGQPAMFETGCLVKQGGSPLTFGEIKTLAAANMEINMIALYTGGGMGGAANWPIIFYS